jgi:DUF4097 and DUF4098 domain-containing protein YvlB
MDYTRTIEHTFETAEKAVLHVESRSGSVTVASHGASSIIVEAVVHVWSEQAGEADEAAMLVERGMAQDDQQRVIIRAPTLPQSEGWSFWGKRGARVDYNIRVPVRTAVRVLSRSGRVGIARTEGRVHVESGSGRIHVEDIAGDVAVVSRSGSVSIDRVQGAVNAEARSGRIDIRNVAGNLVVQSRSGAIELREVAGDLEARGHTGSVTIENAHGGVSARAHTGSVRYTGLIEGEVVISAHTGGITLAVDPAQPFFLDAESDTGAVRSELPPRRGDSAALPANGHKVRLRTHTGSIRITRR